MARNVVGWNEGNGDTLDLSKLGGAEGNLNGVSAYEIFATVRDTEVNAAAGVAVDAHNRLQLEAINGALSVPTGAGAAALALLEVGATALVATNRMRTDTRAQVSDSERKKKFAAAGVVSISAVDAVTADLAKGSPQGLAASKAYTTAAVLAGFDRDAARFAEQSARLFDSDEAREGMLAFLEKRPPHWAARI